MSIFVFDDDESMHELKINEITCIRKLDKNRKIMFSTRDNHFFAPTTIKQLSDVYSPRGFVQIDKNKLINLRQVDEIKGKFIYVGNHIYEVSRRRLDEIQDMLDNLNN